MNYVYVGLGIILLVAIIYLYFYYYGKQSTVSSDQKYLMDTVTAKDQFTNLANPESRRYSISMWVYVNNPSMSSAGYNFFTITDGNNYRFSLSISNTGQLQYTLNDSTNTYKTIVTNFAFQKWVNIVMSVDSNIVDFYLDGKMMKSDKNNNAQKYTTSKSSEISYGQNMDMYISEVARFPYPMDPQTVWKNYSSAMKKNNANASGMKLVITKDLGEIQNFQLY